MRYKQYLRSPVYSEFWSLKVGKYHINHFTVWTYRERERESSCAGAFLKNNCTLPTVISCDALQIYDALSPGSRFGSSSLGEKSVTELRSFSFLSHASHQAPPSARSWSGSCKRDGRRVIYSYDDGVIAALTSVLLSVCSSALGKVEVCPFYIN